MPESVPDTHSESKPTGLRRIWLAFFYSMAGFKSAWQGEAAFRQEMVLAIVLVPLGMVVGEGTLERIALVGSVLLVLIVELLNSAIEATVDRISSEIHPLAKNAKDMGSAAVFISLALVVFVWGLVIVDRWL